METRFRFLAPPSQCPYLEDKTWQLEYEIVRSLTPEELHKRINEGWRKFGYALFRPRCPSCSACQSIRVLVNQFQPDRSQRRVTKANANTRLEIGTPSIDAQKVDLYMRHHLHHAATKGWHRPSLDHAVDHIASFEQSPFPLQEWCYFIDDQLVSVSYIDVLPDGYSGVYFYHAPEHRDLSLGTWIVLSMIQQAAKLSLPYIYLGYFVRDCRSMEYKGRFKPSETIGTDGNWQPFAL